MQGRMAATFIHTNRHLHAYTRDFLKYIQTQDAALRELVKIARATPACLVCF
jgi:hypothetical protein